MNIFVHIFSTNSSMILSSLFEKSSMRVIVCQNIKPSDVVLVLFQEQVGNAI